MPTARQILVTGAEGFIGKNLVTALGELDEFTVSKFVRGDSISQLSSLVRQADGVIHLAGENRPVNEQAFNDVNEGLTASLCDALLEQYQENGRTIPLVLASSTQAQQENPYGKSKLAAENLASDLVAITNSSCSIFRLPGVFGKWCKPDYNSVVATFCQNIARGLPIHINDAATSLTLVYIDDVVKALITALNAPDGLNLPAVTPEFSITLGQLASQIQAFNNCRSDLITEPVGVGLVRALYSTYISYLPVEDFSYKVPQYSDSRGIFVEMLKTQNSGQFSYFTAHPGITRGGHYHHTKTEKFLVVKGQALFKFRHLQTDEVVEITTNGEHPEIIDTIPGWAHDITNVGDDEMIVMLWANENFDRENPDTVASKV